MLITSRNNPLVKELAELAKKPRADSALAEGYHLCREALLSGVPVLRLLYTEEAAASAEGSEIFLLARERCPLTSLTLECYEKISRLQSPEGMAIVFQPRVTELSAVIDEDCRLLVAAGVQDPGNAGALVRVAEAAGASGCVFVDGVDLLGGKFLRAAMGSAFRLPCVRASLHEFLTAASALQVIVAQMRPGSLPYDTLPFTPPVAICVGAEGTGIPPELASAAQVAAHIPMAGRVESLNVSVAAGILLYQARRNWAPLH